MDKRKKCILIKRIELLFPIINHLPGGIFMSYFVLRVKNDREIKSRVLYAILSEKPSYSVKEYKEEPDPSDNNYHLISITAYERGPYRQIRKILGELIRNNDIECLNGSSSDLF
ncbi:MAG: hypothetical protein LUQ05_01110 [Methanoregula sp.]|nr:hypothetical protein [Methanoregula sp.]